MFKYVSFSGGSLRKNIVHAQSNRNRLNSLSFFRSESISNVRGGYRSISSQHLVPITCSSQKSLDLYDEALNLVRIEEVIVL
jgi:hypothetical protein